MTCKIIFTALFTTPMEPSCFASSVVTPQGCNAGVVAPMQPTSSLMISHHSSTYFPMAEKKEENREKDLKKEERVVELTGSCLFFPSISWRSQVDLRQRLCKSTCKIS
jgi:hypothetical protein